MTNLSKNKNKKLTTSGSNSMLETIQAAALNPDVDTEKMNALLDMQERIVDKNSESAFNISMVKVQKEMPQIEKESNNRQTNSKYAKLEHIDKVITPIFTSHGFALMFGTGDSPLREHIRITCDTLHEQGHSKHSFYDIPIDDKGIKGTVNKTQPHASASSITYGQRILKCLIFNVQLAEDIDGNIANVEWVSEKQVANINALLIEVGADKVKFLKWLQFESVEDMPANQYDRAVNALEKKRS